MNCISSRMESIESIDYGPAGKVYLTIYMEVNRGSTECQIYYKILNAVNLPPEIPPQIVGMDMTFNIMLSEFPISSMEADWCGGELVDYFSFFYTWQ